jgi:hypothetical protein
MPVESDIPERASKRVPAMTKAKGATWPDDLGHGHQDYCRLLNW